MKLFQYEMKKLLFNKSRLILLAALFLLYALLGFGFTSSESELSGEAKRISIEAYESLVQKSTGTLKAEQLAESTAILQGAIAEYGKGEPLMYQLNRNGELKFHNRYVQFGQKVSAYWNGPEEQDTSDIRGVYPLQEKLAALEASGQSGTYEYRKYADRLEKEIAIGEPVFADVSLWDAYSLKDEGILIVFLLLMPMTFFLSSLFTQEVKTEMDSVVLCSLRGRHEIVTAKLLSGALTAASIAAVYLVGYLLGMLIGHGDISGYAAPARCLEMFGTTTLNISVLGMAALGSLWLVLASVAFGLVLSFISAIMKGQSAAFGIGMVVLIAGAMSGSLSGDLRKILWPVRDFNFGTLATVGTIFGGDKVYNIFGLPVSYGLVAFVVGVTLGGAACLLTYVAQKKRAVA